MWIEKDEIKRENVCGTIAGNVHGGIVIGLMFLRKCLRRHNEELLFKGLMIWISLKDYCYRATHRGIIYAGRGLLTT